MPALNAERAMALIPDAKVSSLDDPTSWVDRHGDTLLRFALSRVGRQDIAEDLVQDTFLAAWRARESFDGRALLGTWLCGILRRKIADYYRLTAREQVFADVESNEVQRLFTKRGKWVEPVSVWRESPEQLMAKAEFWAVIANCLERLPAHLAEAFQLREVQRASVDEVSSATGITAKNLSVRLHRARLLLRGCLDQKWFRDGA
ncbi:MAG TPA: sigma-70 family RNA polymerase sigma factor [Lacipirellulaceae bacterium]|jgi:RNA polymerase sigma-70 factor (ECF subfamily)|nr:sigma-70 family RNA polymerase sigma factor [Lacipirellulaceae bacterium]